MIDFVKPYSQNEWKNFLENTFLKECETLQVVNKDVNLQKVPNIKTITKACIMFTEKSLKLTVLEIYHTSSKDARVSLTKEARNILETNSNTPNALILFVPQEDASNYRFSLLQRSVTLNKDGSVSKDYSSPKRFSFLLGKDCKPHTANQYLIGKGTVINLEDLKSRFSVEAVTKEFYDTIFAWYEWAVKLAKYPQGSGANVKMTQDGNEIAIIRLITRIMFVWFIKQKKLIPDWIFSENALQEILRDFDAKSATSGNYYNAVLQNLFFATLNNEICDRQFTNTQSSSDQYGIKTFYRDDAKKSFFTKTQNEIVALFHSVPYLNGGLFKCLDYLQNGTEGVRNVQVYIDGFSREKSRRAFLPNILFFGDEKHEGIITILNRYNFTVQENTPLEVQVALDPELLGKVFENLLASVNPETNESARKESGSFYTPREIVNYMVDESLKAVLINAFNDSDSSRHCERSEAIHNDNAIDCHADKSARNDENVTNANKSAHNDSSRHCECNEAIYNEMHRHYEGSKATNNPTLNSKLDLLFDDASDENPFSEDETKTLLGIIHSLKVLDPACGSGAFPVGVLHRLVALEQKLQGDDGRSPYQMKLDIIKNNIYGVDIQSIAVQITKLRFFISLVCEEVPNDNASDNYGIQTLPNLETKFVVANTLVGLEKNQDNLLDFDDPQIEELQKELQKVRNESVTVRTAKESYDNRAEDDRLSGELLKFITQQKVYNHDDAIKIASYHPHNPNSKADFFDTQTMFAFSGGFDIVLGNPPYGAKTSTAEKEYYKATYEAAKTIKNVQKGSLNTFAVFINQGYNLLKRNGILSFIVPIAITSGDSMQALHKLLFNNCRDIFISSYAVRPQPVFQNAVVNTSIILFNKTFTPCENLYSTKMYRKGKGFTLQNLLSNLEFAKVNGLCLQGRIPKISSPIEVSILKKFQKCKKISDFIKEKGKPIYYRAAGGRYYKIVTNYSTGSSTETCLYFDEKMADVIGCILSSNLSFWFYQTYSDNLSWNVYEIGEFRVPPLTAQHSALITNLYASYLADIERNAIVHSSSGKSSYKVATFKEYKIRKSKALIDRIDDAICPLYGLTAEETAFIKNYEIEFRVDE